MNILRIYDSISGLFPQRITVTIIHAKSNELIGSYKMSTEQLPEVFNRPTVLDIEGKTWRVINAFPFHANDYRQRKKITLHVSEPNTENGLSNTYMVPTISQLPPISEGNSYEEFTIPITRDGWKQMEFFAISDLPLIQEEVIVVEEILNSINETDGLLGYSTIHQRDNIKHTSLDIPLDEFYLFVNGREKGCVQITSGGIIKDTFAIRTDNYDYYGIALNNRITELCLQYFDCADDEFTNIIEKYELVMVDWCNGNIIF